MRALAKERDQKLHFAPSAASVSVNGNGAPRPSTLPRWLTAILRVPLVGKIAGANAVIVVSALAVAVGGGDPGPAAERFTLVLAAALTISLVVNVILVLIALGPLDALETTAQRIWRGEMEARVPHSPIADADLQRIGSAFNALLDGLTSDRARMRSLAAQVISAGDRERAYIARELHDSTAQTLAALLLELSVLATENRDPQLVERIERVRRIVSDVLDEVKLLAHTVHPRVLDDLGLAAAIRLLAREAGERSRATVSVEEAGGVESIPVVQTSVLYRVAQEAVNNALRHGKPEHVVLRLGVEHGVARLEVEDDGVGFDIAEAEARRSGMGLFTMRERAALVGGALEIHSESGRGTRIVAIVPIATPLAAQAS